MRRLAIITDDPGWHGARLTDAFGRRGYQACYVSLTRCRLYLGQPGIPIRMSGFENGLPDGVFVRGVPGGSLEQVVHYLDILHALKRLGIPVYNDAGAVERSVDKAMTSFLLQQAGIPTPATWVTPTNSEALAIASDELQSGRKLVVKPVFGSQGQGVRKLDTVDDLGRLVSSNGVFYLQRFVENALAESCDWRVFVINGKADGAMRRFGKSWLNNVAQGARCEVASLDGDLKKLAEDAVAVLEMNYGGVDLMLDSRGRYTVIEVNSIPAWKGLESVTGVDVADRLAADFLRFCPALSEERIAIL
jgi:RimK family alpha-L-glutamate ligase